MRRSAIAGTLSLALATALAPSADAGGATFNFERENYQPGDRVSGRVTFGRGVGPPIRAEDGPFMAYALKGGRYIDAPKIPADAIPLGPMTLTRIDSGTWLARLEFTLPDVPPGSYTITYCNDPCTNSALGELTYGWFRVIPGGEDGATYLVQERLEKVRRTLRQRARQAMDRAREAEHDARGLQQEVNRLRETNRRLAQRIASFERAGARAPRPAGFPVVLGWLLVGLTVVFGLVVFRPRRRPVLAPDPPAIERIDEPEREPV
jgi:hypothetical protein